MYIYEESMVIIYGPSLGYIAKKGNVCILILGDKHTPLPETQNENTIHRFLQDLSRSTPLSLYIEDVPFIAPTTAMREVYEQQKNKVCTNDVCRPVQADEIDPNGAQGRKSTLQGLNEFLFTCERDSRICPLDKRSSVSRVDQRAQQIIIAQDERVVQVVDDRSFKFDENNCEASFVHLCNIVDHRQPQLAHYQTGISLPFLKVVCDSLNDVQGNGLFDKLKSWWQKQVLNTYAPWKKNEDFMFSKEYNLSWTEFPRGRRALLHLIMTNALMDLYCVSKLIGDRRLDDDGLTVVYLGCAHAESIASFFRYLNDFCMYPSKTNVTNFDDMEKYVEFSDHVEFSDGVAWLTKR